MHWSREIRSIRIDIVANLLAISPSVGAWWWLSNALLSKHGGKNSLRQYSHHASAMAMSPRLSLHLLVLAATTTATATPPTAHFLGVNYGARSELSEETQHCHKPTTLGVHHNLSASTCQPAGTVRGRRAASTSSSRSPSR